MASEWHVRALMGFFILLSFPDHETSGPQPVSTMAVKVASAAAAAVTPAAAQTLTTTTAATSNGSRRIIGERRAPNDKRRIVCG